MVTLTFDPALGPVDDIRNNLSAIVPHGQHLWLGGDEGTMIERLTRDAAGNYGSHRRFDLSNLLGLPGREAKPSELDLEGLALDSGYLWLTGSHSLKRKKPKDEPLTDLAKISREANRFTLGRVPLIADEPVPKSPDGKLTAARLRSTASGNELTDAIAKDKLLAPFLSIPSKDNGLDIEGLAVSGNRVFVGCRGPVLRGFAVVIDFETGEAGDGFIELAAPGGSGLRRHLLDLDGLGVRDLAIDGSDLLILAGPTMVLDGPAVVFRWPRALEQRTETFVPASGLVKALAVPFAYRADHAEGIAVIAGRRVMICYDSPSGDRARRDSHSTTVDVFDLTA